MLTITRNGFKLAAARNYKNPFFLDEEFDEEVLRFKSLVRQLAKFDGESFQSNLALNNFIVACNCFGVEFATEGLFVLTDDDSHDTVETFIHCVLILLVGKSKYRNMDAKFHKAFHDSLGKF